AFVWDSKCGPGYQRSMLIGIVAIVMNAQCALGRLCSLHNKLLLEENRQLETAELAELKEGNREHVRETARLEGITFNAGLERRRGFGYLY
ncbi:hypothetical protein BD410DRAFT_733605, partial [Rickenella mellea]